MFGFTPYSTTPLSSPPPIDVVSGGALPLASVNALVSPIFAGSSSVQVIGTVSCISGVTLVLVASVNGTAQVNTNAVYEAFGEGAANGLAVVVLDANRFTFGDASITAEATVDSGYVVLKFTSASALSEATIQIIASAIFSQTETINGVAMAELTAERITTAESSVNGVAQYTVTAELVGEGWTDLPQGTNVWLRKG